jgi:ligand-binding SRPBCC domain-containing protein
MRKFPKPQAPSPWLQASSMNRVPSLQKSGNTRLHVRRLRTLFSSPQSSIPDRRSSILVPSLHRTTLLAAPRREVFAFFSDPANLARITPPALGFTIIERPDRPLRRGDRIRYTIRLLGVRVGWTTHITEWVEGVSFVDEQERGPYRRWRHTHRFEERDGGTLMTDEVDYEVPLGAIGWLVTGWWVRRSLKKIFDYRAKVITSIFG